MKKLLLSLGVASLSTPIIYYGFVKNKDPKFEPLMKRPFPTRSEILSELKSNEFDILVIGGGSVGTGIALDAVTRGLKVALVEKEDFASGTSSKSTKLVHGGVRYLEKAILKLDYQEFKLVTEALYERASFKRTAPHLSNNVPILLPCYQYFQVPYYYVGSKLYDLFSGTKLLQGSSFLSKKRTLEEFPLLKSENLKGSIVYYDGQHNDSRMNLALALTAIEHGASVSNYLEVENLLFNNDKISGVKVQDKLTNESFEIKSKVVINATGPYSDSIQKMEVSTHKDILLPSKGIHLVLPGYYSPNKIGLIDPVTSDGRVIFLIPWLNNLVVGTTDEPKTNLKPNENEIDFLLKELSHFLSIPIEKKDIKSTWGGLRPLVNSKNEKGTKSISRNHWINIGEKNLVSICGGKWTTYRKMSQDVIDHVLTNFKFEGHEKCRTEYEVLFGARTWTPKLEIDLIRKYPFLTYDQSHHLSSSYGDQSEKILSYQRNVPLDSNYPILESEILYHLDHEYAVTAFDILSRRTRLAYLDVDKTIEILPKVVDIMGDHLNWNKSRRNKEIQNTMEYLEKEFSSTTKKLK